MVVGLRARASAVFRVFAFTLSLFPVAYWVIVVCRVTDGVFLLSLICHFRILIKSLNTNITDLSNGFC